MHTGYHARIGDAAKIPINAPKPIISFSPVVLDAPGRPVPLELRVTVPSTSTADALPIVLLSHGHGRSNYLSSLEGYAPLAEFWAAHGFAVLQPTQLDSAFLGLTPPPGQDLFWQERAVDMVRILDNLDAIETSVPGLTAGRLDRTKVAIAGHSAGGWTAAMLLGANNTNPCDGSTWYKPEPRIKVGIVLAGIGNGGADISESGKTLFPSYGGSFGKMTTPALVVFGDEDVSPHLTVRGADWHADPYTMAPGPKDLLTLPGAKHGLGGISGWDTAETLDEDPERLAVVQRMTWAYLWSRLYEVDPAWKEACKALEGLQGLGKVESKD
ncbi:Alpha/Beta hydrolase protein [Pseudomassariella vexata]|uniref:Alpha/Beta hydrolase protein n=1 Tax=Pseudomassariella vexata TaxID=1141098 RepID=A0A1Y2E9U0_9PEZI|nr:Alpha/Beta hydrolase protein [Pseudomassariella vexata]ORY68319.1 Alpha/Beta hydrolase protein [Pseudomassariella vexata]